MDDFDRSGFKVPAHLKPKYDKARGQSFLLLKGPVEIDKGATEFVYCYSFRRDRELFRHTWHLEFPFRRRRHLAKVGKASGDPISEIKKQFPTKKTDDGEELKTRSVPEYPQIEIIALVNDAYDCEQYFHDYVRAQQFLGGAGHEFFFTNGLEVLRFCRIWSRNRKRAIRMAENGLDKSKRLAQLRR